VEYLTIFRLSTRRKVPPYSVPVPGSKVLLHIATDAKFAHHVAFGVLCDTAFGQRCLKVKKRATWKVTYIHIQREQHHADTTDLFDTLDI
jgi:hypothetical protein